MASAFVEACAPVIAVLDEPPEHLVVGDRVALDLHVVNDLRTPVDRLRAVVTVAWAVGKTSRSSVPGGPARSLPTPSSGSARSSLAGAGTTSRPGLRPDRRRAHRRALGDRALNRAAAASVVPSGADVADATPRVRPTITGVSSVNSPAGDP